MNNLSELSKSYYTENDIYETFSYNEDFPHYIFDALVPLLHNKNFLDLGCGNGKYLNLFSSDCPNLIGIDRSFEQLSKITKEKNIELIQADASQIPLKNESIDNILSCWMLGTILDKKKQEQVFYEMTRIIKPKGKIILVENDIGGEFEELRGRYPDIENKTQKYNDWLLSLGFKKHKQIKTYFQFNYPEQAQFIFESIWADRLTRCITSSKIEHNVIIFIYEKE